jgi:hypothetical protein
MEFLRDATSKVWSKGKEDFLPATHLPAPPLGIRTRAHALDYTILGLVTGKNFFYSSVRIMPGHFKPFQGIINNTRRPAILEQPTTEKTARVPHFPLSVASSSSP